MSLYYYTQFQLKWITYPAIVGGGVGLHAKDLTPHQLILSGKVSVFLIARTSANIIGIDCIGDNMGFDTYLSQNLHPYLLYPHLCDKTVSSNSIRLHGYSCSLGY